MEGRNCFSETQTHSGSPSFVWGFFSERGKRNREKLLGGCQQLKLQPHLASCYWALITCRVKFHHWIKVKEGANEGWEDEKQTNKQTEEEKNRGRHAWNLAPVMLHVTALLAVIKISMNCWIYLQLIICNPTMQTHTPHTHIYFRTFLCGFEPNSVKDL